MKIITKLSFLFYTHPKKSYHEIPQDFIKFEDMTSIPKPTVMYPREVTQVYKPFFFGFEIL